VWLCNFINIHCFSSHFETVWTKLVKLWALQWKAKRIIKLGLLTNKSLIDIISWNQLTSVKGGGTVKLENKLHPGILIIKTKYHSSNKSKLCCRGQSTAFDFIASGISPPLFSSKKVSVLLEQGEKPSRTHIWWIYCAVQNYYSHFFSSVTKQCPFKNVSHCEQL
jgi:hypothetical protein